MKTEDINGVTLYYKESQHETADIIIDNIQRTQKMLEELWELDIPGDCRVYIMDDFKSFLKQSTPFAYKPLLFLNFLLAGAQYEELWKVAGGFAKQYGKRHVIGIKDKKLISLEENETTKDLFEGETSIEDKITNILCHEITHAATQEARLPLWLHEGAALIAVDTLLEKETVKPGSIELFKAYYTGEKEKDILTFYIMGYWSVKYLSKEEPELLKKILKGEEKAPEEDDIYKTVFDFYFPGEEE